ncbi:hypothetical protein PHLCEN_2v8472 [Hermanssonia centrifuga]|uniref:Uncharacterized protein n=1 Tax=Hermanssonia centrifuga TaxID=98765 RepID=A0A2R6NTI1_9APHY|nr:hypothetical protein PHLCEN_2v8472 [Hermanssonia centrifuga]
MAAGDCASAGESLAAGLCCELCTRREVERLLTGRRPLEHKYDHSESDEDIDNFTHYAPIVGFNAV